MPAGRPTKKTPTREEIILEALRQGNTRTCACSLAGISLDLLREWTLEKPEFLGAVLRAEADAEHLMVEALKKGATEQKDWRAAESWLKRRRREDWGDSIDVRKLSDDQLLRLLEGPADSGSTAPGTGPAGVGAGVPNGNGKH